MKILFAERRLILKEAEPVTFEIYSQGTGHLVTYDLVSRKGLEIENQRLLPENERLELNYDPLRYGKGTLKLDLGFSEPHGGNYQIKVLGGYDRKEIAQFQIAQRFDTPHVTMLFGLEGDDDVDAPE